MIRVFILFSERTPPQKETNYRLLILTICTTFASVLSSFFLGENRRVERTYSSKENEFLSIRFLLSQFILYPLFSITRHLQTKWGIICIAINGKRLAEMFSLFRFINHGQLRLISRTNTLLTIVHLSSNSSDTFLC